MRIGILGGTGSQGFGLALRWANSGHDIRIGSRDAERGEKKAVDLESKITNKHTVKIDGGSNAFACDSDVVVLAIPADQVETIVSPNLNILIGKIVLDITVNMKFGKFTKVLPINGVSSYEYVRTLLPESKVVACLKTVAADLLLSGDDLDQTDFQIATDDDAFEISAKLASIIGLTPVRVRGKFHGETLERLVALAIQLNKEYPGSHIGYSLVGKNDSSN